MYYPKTLSNSNLGRGDSYLSIDPILYSKLQDVLGQDGWTYFSIQYGTQVEVLRTVDFVGSNIISVQRGHDGTDRGTFPIGSEITFVPTVAAILDNIDIPKLYIDTLGGVTYENNKLVLPAIDIVALGGVGLLNSAVLDCCPTTQAPEVELDLEPLRVTSGNAARLTSDDEYRIWR